MQSHERTRNTDNTTQFDGRIECRTQHTQHRNQEEKKTRCPSLYIVFRFHKTHACSARSRNVQHAAKTHQRGGRPTIETETEADRRSLCEFIANRYRILCECKTKTMRLCDVSAQAISCLERVVGRPIPRLLSFQQP